MCMLKLTTVKSNAPPKNHNIYCEMHYIAQVRIDDIFRSEFPDEKRTGPDLGDFSFIQNCSIFITIITDRMILDLMNKMTTRRRVILIYLCLKTIAVDITR